MDNAFEKLFFAPESLDLGERPSGVELKLKESAITSKLEFCLPFLGNIRDYGQSNFTFTLKGNAVVTNDGLQLDGTGDYVVGQDGSPGVQTNPTSEIYIVQFRTHEGARQGLFYTAAAELGITTFDRQIGLGDAGGMWARWWTQSSSAGAWGESPTDFTDGRLHTAVIYADKANDSYECYVDGRLEDSASSADNGFDGYTNNYLHIGAAGRVEVEAGVQYFNGTITLAARIAGDLPRDILREISSNPWPHLFEYEITEPAIPQKVRGAITGTITATIDETDIVAGSKTIIITLNNDIWVAAGGTFDAQRQAIIDGLNSAQAEGTGWNAEVRDKEVVGSVVRTSDTVVTITLSAAAAYDITAQETITMTIPASALVTSSDPVTGVPTFTVDTTAQVSQTVACIIIM